MSIQHIQDSLERIRSFLNAHPDRARSADSPATAIILDGLHCRVDGPGEAFVETDMPDAVGGSGSAPTPGWMMRAALASCDATLIAMCAAERGIVLKTLEVMVESESDDRGLMGMGDSIPPGPLQIETCIRIIADETTDEDLYQLVEEALARSPVANALQRTVLCRHKIEIS